jgi:hypothetical protein
MYLQTQHFPQMTYQNEIKELTVTKSLRLLRDGFKHELADFIFADQRTVELFHELITEFVDANIPIVDENNQVELAMMLLETLNVTAR